MTRQIYGGYISESLWGSLTDLVGMGGGGAQRAEQTNYKENAYIYVMIDLVGKGEVD